MNARSVNAWRQVLQEECDRTSQGKVATLLGYSPTVINQVLKRVYPGNTNKVQAKVEGAFMGVTVDCPVVGTLARNLCIENQGRPFAATNPQRVALYSACRNGCPHSQIGDN